MPEAHMSHDGNVVGAAVLLLADRLGHATAQALGAGAVPAAVATLGHHSRGRTIEQLAQALRVSHSRAVRIVDRLERDGLARRAADDADRRAVRVSLTPRGRRELARLHAERAAAIEQSLDVLDPADRRALTAIAERLLASATHGRADAHTICRLCDSHACGHEIGLCPVTQAADAAAGIAG